ncbi:hypothetical protein MMC11_004945 [Xylographa trunciseda]|nr:hypothetical protein [Xylographa trunciseda]
MWSVPASADLSWVAEGKSYERQRLNERPIYLRSVFYMLATTQAIIHLYYDYDRVVLPIGPPGPVELPVSASNDTKTPLNQLKVTARARTISITTRAVATGLLGPVFYALCIRWIAWPWTVRVARLMWNIQRDSVPPRFPPYHIGLILRSITAGLMLLCIWEFSNAAFSAYVAQQPLKNGYPLTTDSRDPNGSLLNGLKSKKEIPRTFAFWELLYITQRYTLRRNSIFSEIDRAGGATWAQVLNTSLVTIQAITSRIIDFEHPRPSAPLPAQQAQQKVEELPRIVPPTKYENVLSSPSKPRDSREKLESAVGSMARSFGQSQPASSPISPRAKQAIDFARDKLLTTDQKNAIDSASLKSLFFDYVNRFLRTPIVGAPFRQTFERRVRRLVLGSPYSQLSPIVSAIDSVANLALASLKEDQFGTVNKDLPLIIRTFANVIQSVERIIQQMPIHWTDTEFQDRDGEGRRIEEVELVLEHLRWGLRQLLEDFGPYALDLGLGPQELKACRGIVGIPT